MISSLSGTVVSLAGASCVLDVGGVGFAVQITPAHGATLRLDHKATVVTELIVRDDALALFGFASTEHLTMFTLLRSVPGVGPKSAMGTLSVLSPDEIATAVRDENDAIFRKVPGIGAKTAKLLVVHLTGKVDVIVERSEATRDTASIVIEDVVAALVELGWSHKVAQATAEKIGRDVSADHSPTVPELLRQALAELGPSR